MTDRLTCICRRCSAVPCEHLATQEDLLCDDCRERHARMDAIGQALGYVSLADQLIDEMTAQLRPPTGPAG